MNAPTPILVTGAGGMLGRAWTRLLASRGIPFRAASRAELDIAHDAGLAQWVEGVGTVVNCAAWTDVDGAEAREAEATLVNGRAVATLAARCREAGALLVHVSTDYVFDGRASTPYAVDHPRAPANAYGRSKAAGEEALEASGADYLLVRTSWVVAPWGRNFVATMLDLGRERDVVRVVADQVGRPTSAASLAARTLALVEAGARGTFHVAGEGQCTWHEFAEEVMRLGGRRCRVDPCTTADFPRPARRPAYSVLDLSRTTALIGPGRPWQQEVADVVAELLAGEA